MTSCWEDAKSIAMGDGLSRRDWHLIHVLLVVFLCVFLVITVVGHQSGNEAELYTGIGGFVWSLILWALVVARNCIVCCKEKRTMQVVSVVITR